MSSVKGQMVNIFSFAGHSLSSRSVKTHKRTDGATFHLNRKSNQRPLHPRRPS